MAYTLIPLGSAALGTNGTVVSLTTTAEAPSGSTIIVVGAGPSSSTFTITDDDAQGANVYTARGPLIEAPSTDRIWVFDAVTDDTLPIGSIITGTLGVIGKPVITAFAVVGLTSTPFDVIVASGNSASSSTAPQADPVTPTTANSLVLGIVIVNNGYAFTFTQPDGTWTALTKAGFSAAEDGLFVAHKEVAGTSAVTYGPATISSAGTWVAGSIVYKIAPSGSASVKTMLMMGAG